MKTAEEWHSTILNHGALDDVGWNHNMWIAFLRDVQDDAYRAGYEQGFTSDAPRWKYSDEKEP